MSTVLIVSEVCSFTVYFGVQYHMLALSVIFAWQTAICWLSPLCYKTALLKWLLWSVQSTR